jgi:Skp family chaperone for outer membrane proteins
MTGSTSAGARQTSCRFIAYLDPHYVCLQAERRVQEQRTRKGTQPFFIGGRSRDAEEEEEQEDPRAARARAQAERRAEQERAKQEAASARAQEQVRWRMARPEQADPPGPGLLPVRLGQLQFELYINK